MATRRPADPLLAALAAELHEMRVRCGLSLRQLEQMTFTSNSALSRHLSGRTLAPWSVVELLCRSSGRDPAELRVLWEQAHREQARRRQQRGRKAPPEPAEPPDQAESPEPARSGAAPVVGARTSWRGWTVRSAVVLVVALLAFVAVRQFRPSPAAEVPASAVPAGVSGWWPLSETSGLVARDASGRGVHARLSGRVSWTASRGERGATFDGQGTISAPHAAVRTDRSFSVAAWVLLTDTNTWATAVSQDGTSASGFFLQYSLQEDRWAFSIVTADAKVLPAVRALDREAPQVGTWTHLVGVYDAERREQRLYVNGQHAGAIKRTRVWSATGPLRIGRAQWGGFPADHWRGSIRDVVTAQRAITPAEIASLARN